MKRTKIMFTAIIAAAALALLVLPVSASAGQVGKAAKGECKQEQRVEPGEFQREWGSGKAAIKRCAQFEKRDAKRDCKGDRRGEPGEFSREYGGTDGAALKRCILDELR